MENKTINSFINRYQLSKTLRFKLKPVGETETNFIKKGLLEEDKQRAQDYIRIKHVIDDYHKAFVDKVLSDPKIVDANEYAELYYKSTKNDKEIKEMKDIEARLRKQISSALTKNPLFGKLFKKELFTDILPEFIKTYEDYRFAVPFNNSSTVISYLPKNLKPVFLLSSNAIGSPSAARLFLIWTITRIVGFSLIRLKSSTLLADAGISIEPKPRYVALLAIDLFI